MTLKPVKDTSPLEKGALLVQKAHGRLSRQGAKVASLGDGKEARQEVWETLRT